MKTRTMLAVAMALGAATPAAAMPGFVTGEGTGTIFLELNADPALDIALTLPDYSISYSSFGSYHEDGFDTSFINDFNSIVLGFDLYAYAFSAPFVPTLHSEVNGSGYFADGIIATISNPTATLQQVQAHIETSLSLSLNAEQPLDLTSGSVSYTVLGSGAGNTPLSISFADGFAPATGNRSLYHSTSDNFLFDLAPGEIYSFRIEDFGTSYFLRAQAVPEPATWAMMIAGFLMVGAAMRKSRRGAVAIASRAHGLTALPPPIA